VNFLAIFIFADLSILNILQYIAIVILLRLSTYDIITRTTQISNSNSWDVVTITNNVKK